MLRYLYALGTAHKNPATVLLGNKEELRKLRLCFTPIDSFKILHGEVFCDFYGPAQRERKNRKTFSFSLWISENQ
jgi:hypothetical protein